MRRGSLVVVFLATVGVVLLFWALVPGGWTEKEATDYRSFYLPVAQNLVEGRGLVTSEGGPAVRYPPGFPLLLAGLFGSARWTGTPEVLWLQGFILLAMGWAAVGFCGLAWVVVGECGALVAAGLRMTYPFNLWLTKQPNSELLFLPLFYGALLLCGGALWRSWSWSWSALGAGILMGCSALVRPVALLGGVLLAAVLIALRRKEGWRRWGPLAAWLLAGNLAVLLPWELWAWRHTGQWIPLTTGGPEGMRDGLTCAIVTKGYRRRLDVSPQVGEIMVEAVKRWQQGEIETMGAIFSFLGKQLRYQPLGLLRLLGWKMARAWYGTDTQQEVEKWIILIQMAYLPLTIGGGYLLWHGERVKREWLFLVGVLVLYFWGMTTMVLSLLRYMTPAIGLLFVLPGAGMEWLKRRSAT